MRPTATKLVSLLVVILLSFHGGAHAQLVTGDLQFSVVDSLGDPVPGVNVVVTGPNVQGVRGGVTNDLGFCNVLVLTPGKVAVRLSHTAYQPVVFEDVLIQLRKTTSLGEIRLLQRTVDMPELVVSGQQLSIDPTTTTYGSNLRPSDFESLPIERNYRSISTWLPLVNQSYLYDEVNVAGATGLENNYLIDGVDVTETYKGYTGTDLPYNFIREISMIAGGYEAEYRSALGGILNVVTYSGGNELSGEVFGFFTSNSLTASQRQGPLDVASGQFENYDFGFRLGGPLIRDQLWFLGSYNPKVDRKEVPVSGFGNFPDKVVTHMFAGKLTWKASEKVNLSFNVFGDPSEEDLVAPGGADLAYGNPDPILQKGKGGGINLALQGNFSPNDKFLLEWSLARTNRKLDYEAATERGRDEIFFVNASTDSLSGGTDGPTHIQSFGTTIGVTGTWLSESHTVKSGITFKDIGTDRGRVQHFLLRFSDTLYFEDYREIDCTVHNRIPSLFAQDSWLVSEKLRVNFGLRWDGQFLVGSDGKVHQKILDQIQPRIGIVYLPTRKDDQKFTLSFGRFYQELSTELASAWLVDEGVEYRILYNHDPRVSPSGGDTTVLRNVILPEVKNLKGQYFDEWHVGYERLMSEHLRIGVQGIYRTLGEAIEDSYLSDGTPFFGNPGRGQFSQFPRAKRDYIALVVTFDGPTSARFNFFGSYVLSRNYGNYPGLYNSDNETAAPNVSQSFDLLQALTNGTGLLPNDRTHVFKFSCSYRSDIGLTSGISFVWQTGTPLNEFGQLLPHGTYGFILPRGTAGRSPAIWDLNLRLSYDLPFVSIVDGKSRVILDVFHIASQRKPVDIDQVHYLVDSSPNPTYGLATRYQPPMSVRLGMEVSF